MANLHTIVLILAVNVILIAAKECKCSDDVKPNELDELWQFLETDNNPDIPVLPGELTEYVPCRNCIEQNRRKRKIQNEVVAELRREQRSPLFAHRVWRHENNARNKCPFGYRKLFGRCLKF